MSTASGPQRPVPPYPSPSHPAPPPWAAPAPAPWAAPPPPPVQRHRFARTAMVAVPALLVGAGAAAAITLGVVGHHTATTTGGTGSALASGRHTTVGTLTGVDGSTWTVRTPHGSVAVVVGPHTAFGSKAHPSSQTAFHDGDQVSVVGTRAANGLDAVRVRLDGTATSTAR